MTEENKKTCFVIMPFSKTQNHNEYYWTNHFEYFLKPFIEKMGITAIRSKPLVGDIVKTIIKDLTISDFVIADITDYNPNVFWELGVRHSFAKKGTILIAEKGTTIPFDITQESTHFYYDHTNETPINRTFFKGLEAAFKKCDKTTTMIDSPIFVAISGRGTMHEIIAKDEIIKKLTALILEIKSNIMRINVALKIVRENQKKRKQNKLEELSYPTGRLRVSAIESLFVNQYVDAPPEFYSSCNWAFHETIRLNDQLISWEFYGKSKKGDATENWLIEFAPKIRGELQKLKRRVEKVKLETMNIK